MWVHLGKAKYNSSWEVWGMLPRVGLKSTENVSIVLALKTTAMAVTLIQK